MAIPIAPVLGAQPNGTHILVWCGDGGDCLRQVAQKARLRINRVTRSGAGRKHRKSNHRKDGPEPRPATRKVWGDSDATDRVPNSNSFLLIRCQHSHPGPQFRMQVMCRPP